MCERADTNRGYWKKCKTVRRLTEIVHEMDKELLNLKANHVLEKISRESKKASLKKNYRKKKA